jgi:hypothetical protein
MFRTQKALALCGISADSYRHWKGVLVPLKGRDGRGSSLSLAEVVTLAVIHRAVTKLGIPVSRFGPGSVDLFERIDDHVRDGRTPYFMFLAGDDVVFGGLDDLPDHDAIAAVRVDQVSTTVLQALAGDPETGRQLQFVF